MRTSSLPCILLIGHDAGLGYLVERYARQAGCRLLRVRTISAFEKLGTIRPQVLLFASLEELEAAQSSLARLTEQDVCVLACVAPAEVERARELGVDHCFVHPLTYSDFYRVLASVCPSSTDLS